MQHGIQQAKPLPHSQAPVYHLILVPNTQVAGTSKAQQNEGRKWLIQSQQFRFVVDDGE